jgi:hypothetical protein
MKEAPLPRCGPKPISESINQSFSLSPLALNAGLAWIAELFFN